MTESFKYRPKIEQPSRQNGGPTSNRPDNGKPATTRTYEEGAIFQPKRGRNVPEISGYKTVEGYDSCGNRGYFLIPLSKTPLRSFHVYNGGGRDYGGGSSKKSREEVRNDRRNSK